MLVTLFCTNNWLNPRSVWAQIARFNTLPFWYNTLVVLSTGAGTDCSRISKSIQLSCLSCQCFIKLSSGTAAQPHRTITQHSNFRSHLEWACSRNVYFNSLVLVSNSKHVILHCASLSGEPLRLFPTKSRINKRVAVFLSFIDLPMSPHKSLPSSIICWSLFWAQQG